MAMLANMDLSPERLQELSDGAGGNPCRMVELLYAQEESEKKSSSSIPAAKRPRSARVINAVAAEAKAGAEAEAKAKVAEVAEVAELVEAPEVSKEIEEEEESRVGKRNMLPAGSDEDENAVQAEELPDGHEDGGEEEESQAASSCPLPQSGDGDGNAVQAGVRPLVAVNPLAFRFDTGHVACAFFVNSGGF